ncbi:MAG TPA: ABC transporter permease, partial [Puia sp.]|nr:ABC transporter permease [Puia sp.]
MLYSFFISTLRHLKKRRWYSAVNIIGLTLGLTAAAIVILYTRHELNYDGFHRQADRIYRMSGRQDGVWFAALSAPYASAVYQHPFPEVETVVRMRRWPPRFIRHAEDKFYEPNTYFTDTGSAFFSLFDFPFMEGSPQAALSAPHSVVLTSSLAMKIFGSEDVLGQALTYDTFRLVVTGVIKDLPSNTHFQFNMLIAEEEPMKKASAIFTYCALTPGTNVRVLKQKLLSLPKPANRWAVLDDAVIMPLKNLHFGSNFQYEMKPPGNKLYFYLFLLTGALIILLTCANYMNLSIALYAGRKKEIAVRKVAGAGSWQLAIQFLVESVVLALICLPLTNALVELVLPPFNTFMNTHMDNELARSWEGFGLLAAATLLIGVLSGSYPALVLPRIKAISLFKKQTFLGRGGLSLRQALVGFQVTVLVVMISSSWMIRNQLRYMQETDLGFTREGILKLKGAGMVDSFQFYTLKNELLRNSAIRKVSQGLVPGDEEYGLTFKADGGMAIHQGVINFGTDYDYLNTLGVKLLEGDFKDLSKECP